MDYMNRNPETYSEATIHDRRRRVEKAQRHFDYTQQKADLAQQQLNSTPQQRSVPNILPHSYPIQHVTRTARISLFIKVLDTMTGSIIFTDRITGSYTQSDKHVEGDSFRNVIADPLDLPDNPAMSDKAMHKTIKDMRRSLSVATKKHGQRFVTKMRRAEKIGDSEQAVENCIRYLFAYPVGSDYTNKMISYLESLIPTEKDLVNLNSMLQKQCSVLLRRAQFPASLIDRKNRVMITRLFARMPGHIKMPCTLVAIDGTPVKSIKQVDAIMTQYAVGDRVAVTVASNNKNFSAEIELSKAH